MQAVILTEGLGTGLRPITLQTQKTMVVIDKKPFLEHPLKFIRNFNMTGILLLVGYLGDQIEKCSEEWGKV